MKMNVIYQPSGAAGEYAKYAVNFYNGCSNRCEYCYNRHGLAMKVLGKDEVTLRSPSRYRGNEFLALKDFVMDMNHNLKELQKHGLFFSFVSDPFLKETRMLNMLAIRIAVGHGIPCTVLTKCARVADAFEEVDFVYPHRMRQLLKVGFTLTGHDELEPGASTNMERIEAMKRLRKMGAYVWASIEPVIDLESSFKIMAYSFACCNEYRIGLNSFKKPYTKEEVKEFKKKVDETFKNEWTKVVWKESVLRYIGER